MVNRGLQVVLLIFILGAFYRPVWAEDQTILLDESLIVGTQLDDPAPGQQKRIAGPGLSTALQWEGETSIPLDIPKEILDHLTQSDLSFFKQREAGQEAFEIFDDDDSLESD